uniref:Little elongation complex subunit 1 C-terminal domain-containing protein n=1 Tax=Eptatretus burgeri TaxID=7764 RepID=A0A8C4R7D5_EPTBU
MLMRSCVALCRAHGDAEQARVICYNLLLKGPWVLNVVARALSAAWPNLLASPGPVARAMQAIVNLKVVPRSKEHVSALSELATSFLLAVRKSPRVTLLRSGAAGTTGEDELSAEAWELVFALQLLCAQLGWNWTHNSFIRELIWPLLAKWGKQQDGSLGGNIHVTDPSVATLLRLVGKLGILGLSLCSNNGVKNILEVLVKMLQKTSTEGVASFWQLSHKAWICEVLQRLVLLSSLMVSNKLQHTQLLTFRRLPLFLQSRPSTIGPRARLLPPL